jgi:hypothetical protein
MYNHKDQDRDRVGRIRGWILYILFKQRPKPMELSLLMTVLDKRNHPLSRRRLAEEIAYLLDLRLLKLSHSQAEEELTEGAQVKLIQRFGDCDSDVEMGVVVSARITTAGINFQESSDEIKGIQRVE